MTEKPNLEKVTVLYEAHPRMIPQMLRMAADRIERENATEAIVAVELRVDGSIAVYGWGDTDPLEAGGILHFGLQKLGDMVLNAGGEE